MLCRRHEDLTSSGEEHAKHHGEHGKEAHDCSHVGHSSVVVRLLAGHWSASMLLEAVELPAERTGRWN